MSGKWKVLGLSAVVAVVLVLVLSGTVAASGSGYNLSYSRTSNTSNTSVGLTSVSSSYTSGSNLTASFTVAGTIDLTSSDYLYLIYFGGTAESNATAYVEFTNNTTAGVWYSLVGGFSYGAMILTLSNGGATLTFSIETAVVGPDTSFAIDVFALYGTVTSGSYSWLGTDYNGGGSGSCGPTGCTVTPGSSSNFFSGAVLYAIIGVIVLAVVIVVVLLVVMRKKKGPATGAAAPMQPGWMPPQQPGMAPPPPQNQPMPPPPQGPA